MSDGPSLIIDVSVETFVAITHLTFKYSIAFISFVADPTLVSATLPPTVSQGFDVSEEIYFEEPYQSTSMESTIKTSSTATGRVGESHYC